MSGGQVGAGGSAYLEFIIETRLTLNLSQKIDETKTIFWQCIKQPPGLLSKLLINFRKSFRAYGEHMPKHT